MIEMIHRECCRVAFYYAHVPHPNDIPQAALITLLDGTIPSENDDPICGSCGGPCPNSFVRDLGVTPGRWISYDQYTRAVDYYKYKRKGN